MSELCWFPSNACDVSCETCSNAVWFLIFDRTSCGGVQGREGLLQRRVQERVHYGPFASNCLEPKEIWAFNRRHLARGWSARSFHRQYRIGVKQLPSLPPVRNLGMDSPVPATLARAPARPQARAGEEACADTRQDAPAEAEPPHPPVGRPRSTAPCSRRYASRSTKCCADICRKEIVCAYVGLVAWRSYSIWTFARADRRDRVEAAGERHRRQSVLSHLPRRVRIRIHVAASWH